MSSKARVNKSTPKATLKILPDGSAFVPKGIGSREARRHNYILRMNEANANKKIFFEKAPNISRRRIKNNADLQQKRLYNKHWAIMDDKKPVANGIVEGLCATSPKEFEFPITSNPFATKGAMLHSILYRKGNPNIYSEGMLTCYLNACYYWYLFKHGAFLNPDNNINACGSYYVPYGVCLLYRQCSSYKDPIKKYQCNYVATQTATALAAQVVPNYVDGKTLQINVSEATVVTNVSTTSIGAMSLEIFEGISTSLRSAFDDCIKVQEIGWGAETGELFLFNGNTAPHKIYRFSTMGADDVNQNGAINHFSISTAANNSVLCDAVFMFMLLSHNERKTIASVLESNDYNPVWFDVETFNINGPYAAQIFNSIVDSCPGFPDSDKVMWFMFCWSYLLSFASPMTIRSDIGLFSPAEFNKYEVPFPLQHMAKQMSFRTVNTYWFFDGDYFSWTLYHNGADTTGSSSFGSYGFVSGSMPGPVIIAPGVTATGTLIGASATSWNHSIVNYAYLKKTYPTLFNISTVIDNIGNFCGCFALYNTTALSDSLTSAAMGTMSPLAISRLECSGAMTDGMCSMSEALTIVTPGSNNEVGIAVRVESTYNTARLNAAISTMVTPSTSSKVVGSGVKGNPNAMIMKELSGDNQYIKVSQAEVRELVNAFTPALPYVNSLITRSKDYALNNLPDYVPTTMIYDILNRTGSHGVDLVVGAVFTKFIDLLRGRGRSEL